MVKNIDLDKAFLYIFELYLYAAAADLPEITFPETTYNYNEFECKLSRTKKSTKKSYFSISADVGGSLLKLLNEVIEKPDLIVKFTPLTFGKNLTAAFEETLYLNIKLARIVGAKNIENMQNFISQFILLLKQIAMICAAHKKTRITTDQIHFALTIIMPEHVSIRYIVAPIK